MDFSSILDRVHILFPKCVSASKVPGEVLKVPGKQKPGLVCFRCVPEELLSTAD